MATYDVDPTANYIVQLTPNTGSNYAAVDEGGTPNGDTDYVAGSDGSYKTDLYHFPHPYSLGDIASIIVSMYCKGTGGKAKTAISVGGNTYFGSERTLGSSYAWYTTTYATNPYTAAAWTWGYLMTAGVSLYGSAARCSAVRLRWTYTPSAGDIAVSASATNQFRYLLSAGQVLRFSNNAIITRHAYNPGSMVVGANATIAGYGGLNGASLSSSPLVDLTGTCTVQGTSAAQKLTVKNGLGNGILLNSPKDCLCKWVKTENFNNGAAEPLDRLGVGVLFWGYGYGGATTGNRITECEIYRSGRHGVQVCDVDGAEVDHNLIDGVDANFCVSAFGYGRTPLGVNIHHNILRNSRAEWVNIMNFGGVIKDEDNICENTRADFGHCGYLCSAPISASISRNICKNSNKEAIALNTCSGWLVEDNECSGMALGGDHHAAILLESSADGNCENNIIQDNILVDNYGRVYFAVKEVDGGSHYCLANQILNNEIYGFRALPVHLSPTSGSVQSGNGMD